MTTFFGDLLQTLNPSLIYGAPPRRIFEGQVDSRICFRGVNVADNIPCHQLSKTMQDNLATWYLTPDQHIFDFVILTLFCVLSWRYLYPQLAIYNNISCNNSATKAKRATSAGGLEVPVFFKVISLSCLGWIAYAVYRQAVHPVHNQDALLSARVAYWSSRTLWPCCWLWFGATVFSWWPSSRNNDNIRHMFLQTWISFFSFPLATMMSIDAKGAASISGSFFGSLPSFAMPQIHLLDHHTFLLLFPVYFMLVGKLSMHNMVGEKKGVAFWKWHLFGTTMVVMFVQILTIMSILLGFNISYTLSPPPGFMPSPYLGGRFYRFKLLLLLNIFALGWRGILWQVELILRCALNKPALHLHDARFVSTQNSCSASDALQKSKLQ